MIGRVALTREEDDQEIQRKQSNQNTEEILDELGGSFSRFQLYNYALLSIPIMVSGMVALTYVFTALNLEYRCFVPECDNEDHPRYDTDWLENVIPLTNLKFSKCHRYQQSTMNSNLDLYNYDQRIIDNSQLEFCTMSHSNNTHIVRCDQNGFVYKTDEISIVNEFNLTCKENEWKLAIVGVVNNIARFLFMPLVGIISDRYGRKTILILGLTWSAAAGILQSFTPNYESFIIFEFLNAAIASAVYPAAIILSMEWAKMEHRVTASVIVTSTYCIGITLGGLLASYTRHFRIYLRIAFGSEILVAALMLLTSESIRWLLVKGKQNRIENILAEASRMNKCVLSPKLLDMVKFRCDKAKHCNQSANKTQQINNDDSNTLWKLFSSWTLISRFLISAFCWMTGAYLTYGTSIISVSLHHDKYISFMIVALGGVPASLFSYFFLKYLGRSKSTSLAMFITSASVMLSKLFDNDIWALIMFFTAKCFSTVAFHGVYIQTTELWPTPLRHSMMGLSSTIGRIGSIMAPLSPLLGNIWSFAPFLSFGVMASIAGSLVLFLPETYNKDLPDTIDEAKSLGKKASTEKA